MPVQRANLGGMFGSGVTMQPTRAPDYGAMIEGLANGASSLLHGAYLRKLGEQNRQAAIAQQQAQRAAEQQRIDLENQRVGLERQRFDAANAPTPPKMVYDQQRGVLVNPETGEAHPIAGLPPAPTREAAPHYDASRGVLVSPDGTVIHPEGLPSPVQRPTAGRRPAGVAAATAPVGPDGQPVDLKLKKNESDLAKQYGREKPIQNASAFATNAANTLQAIDAAKAGDRSAHFGVVYGSLQQSHPGIAVKRSDKGLLLDTQGLPADVQMKIARWTGKGGLLTDDALNEIRQETYHNIVTQHALTAPVMAQYGRMARQRGEDSSNVARDPLAGLNTHPAADPDAAARAALASDPGFADYVRRHGAAPAPTTPRLRVPGQP